MDKLGRQPRPIEVFPQPAETVFGKVDGSDPMSSSRELHRLAAGRRTQIKNIRRSRRN